MLEISTALTALRGALDLAKVGLASRDDAKVQAAVADANAKVLDLMTLSMALAEKNATLLQGQRALEDEVRKLKAALEERQRYTLAEVRPGAFAYAQNDAKQGDQYQPPYLCQACYDRGTKAVLNKGSDFAYSPAQWVCPENPKHTFVVEAP